MPPDPAVMHFSQGDLGARRGLGGMESRLEHDNASHGMAPSPVVPAVSPGPFFDLGDLEDYASPGKTTSTHPPRTADNLHTLYYDDSLLASPLTTTSASSFSGDTSASVSHTSFTAVYDLSPPLSPQRPTWYRNSTLRTQDSNPWSQNSHSAEIKDIPSSGAMSPLTSRSTPSHQSSPHAHLMSYETSYFNEWHRLRANVYSAQRLSRSFPSLPDQSTPNSPSLPFNLPEHEFPYFTRIDPSLQGPRRHLRSGHGIYPQRGTNAVHRTPLDDSFERGVHSFSHTPVNLTQGFDEASSSTASYPSFAPSTVPLGLQSGFPGTTVARDALLAYAHHLYSFISTPGLTSAPHFSNPDIDTVSTSQPSQLLALLFSIHGQHPRHLPTLLLLSCVQFSIGEHDGCAETCNKILSVDPNYVEAMSNLGMVMRARGANREAEALWLRAIKLRPDYWDAIDHLLHALCENHTLPNGSVQSPRYNEALAVLDYILNVSLRADGLLLVFIPPARLHRLQNLLHTSGNIRSMNKVDPWAGFHDYIRAIELMFRPPGSVESGTPLQLSDVVVATTVIGLLTNVSSDSPLPRKIASALGVETSAFNQRVLERGIDWLALVQQANSRLLDILLQEGDGALPVVLLAPENVLRIPSALFSAFSHSLPALCTREPFEDLWRLAPGVGDAHAKRTTAMALLALARLFQSSPQNRHGFLSSRGKRIPRSTSLTIVFYYLALSLHPTASTYNNLGIIFDSVKHSLPALSRHGRQQILTGTTLAELYYKKGLSVDPKHPHLLTNYGSLLKDQGRMLEAIGLYQKALQSRPNFDIALANLANVIQDSGAIPKSIAYYKRALEVAPGFPDAICGLSSALSSICDWRWGRGSIGNEPLVDAQFRFNLRPSKEDQTPKGWMGEMEIASRKQLAAAYAIGTGIVRALGTVEDWIQVVNNATNFELDGSQQRFWKSLLNIFYTDFDRSQKARRWYRDLYLNPSERSITGLEAANKVSYKRARLPGPLGAPIVPALLPFHCFTYALDNRTYRLIAHRNALRISYLALKAPWHPQTVYKPPPPPFQKLNVGYVSSDFNNHPLAHLMLSVFGLHNRSRFNIFAYATSASDNSQYRRKIEEDVDCFYDLSASSTESIVKQIVSDQIHILINLGGYTRGTRNDIFAARPCPVQVSLMGYAGTSGAGWCDYLVGDEHACPRKAFGPFKAAEERRMAGIAAGVQGNSNVEWDVPISQIDPDSEATDWAFTERFLHLPHSYFVTDHRQSFREDHCHTRLSPEYMWLEEERMRRSLRKEIFPDIPEDTVIFACFSQMYKICPSAFNHWLKILQRVPNSILWLLRFPSPAEEHLTRAAHAWGGAEVASRVRFTDVAPKEVHIRRCRVADLALDTFQCNAHTIATDVIWSGTPLLTLPKELYKMSSRVASSIAFATGFGDSMVVYDEHAYVERAVALANSISYRTEINERGEMERRGVGELMELRRNLILHRDRMPLFDTPRWTRNFEKGLEEIWHRWAESCRTPWSNLNDEGGVTITDDEPFFSEGPPV